MFIGNQSISNIYVGDQQVNSIYLGTELVYSSTPTPSTPNVVVNGSNITVNDGILSGFSSSDYATLPQPFNSNGASWEIVLEFTTGSLGAFQGIATGLGSGNSIAPCCIRQSYDMVLYYSSDGANWNISNAGVYNYSAQPNTTYRYRYTFDGVDDYKVELWTGSSWSTVYSFQSSLTIIDGGTIVLGNNRGSGNAFNGTINLNECYINIGGQRWWSGMV